MLNAEWRTDTGSGRRFRLRRFGGAEGQHFDADDQACKVLEARARQGNRGGVLGAVGSACFRGQFAHYARFDARARQFPGHHVLVCEEIMGALDAGRNRSAVVGVVCAGIKTVYLRGTQRKLCYIFDLRVDQGCRRCSIGERLSLAAEALAAADGCDLAWSYS